MVIKFSHIDFISKSNLNVFSSGIMVDREGNIFCGTCKEERRSLNTVRLSSFTTLNLSAAFGLLQKCALFL